MRYRVVPGGGCGVKHIDVSCLCACACPNAGLARRRWCDVYRVCACTVQADRRERSRRMYTESAERERCGEILLSG